MPVHISCVACVSQRIILCAQWGWVPVLFHRASVCPEFSLWALFILFSLHLKSKEAPQKPPPPPVCRTGAGAKAGPYWITCHDGGIFVALKDSA